MDHSPDSEARALQEIPREQVEKKRLCYEIVKTTEAKVEYLLALKKLSDMACWRIGG